MELERQNFLPQLGLGKVISTGWKCLPGVIQGHASSGTFLGMSFQILISGDVRITADVADGFSSSSLTPKS
ncbi:hypothetical protein GN956_G898 [Arapaima gigas]